MDLHLRRWVALVAAIALAESSVESQHETRTQACSPNPCGPNTFCSQTEGAPLCQCLEGFTKRPKNIGGCAVLCIRNQDCSSESYCVGGECEPACKSRSCPSGSVCVATDHEPRCTCPQGMYGNPFSDNGCSPYQSNMLVKSTSSTPNESSKLEKRSNEETCGTEICGANAVCSAGSGGRRVCVCKPDTMGDPYLGCNKIDCKAMDDCRPDMICIGLKCVDPCINLCGQHATCTVVNHIATCECLPEYTGDPYKSCKSSFHSNHCPPNTCGVKAECEMVNGKAYCKCPAGHHGNPLYRCTPECERDSDCLNNQHCEKFRCLSVCGSDVCVPGALCNAVGHRPVCTCPPGYLGSPDTRCYPECMDNSHCPESKSCFYLKCTDPCDNACGPNAECEVKNHTAICKCPKGMTGHPLKLCRPITPEDVCNPNRCGTNAECNPTRNEEGYLQAICTCPPGFYGNPLNECKRGNCVNDYDCSSSMVCRRAQCINPCHESGCGINSKCEVKLHRVYCSCPEGYTGNPLIKCNPE